MVFSVFKKQNDECSGNRTKTLQPQILLMRLKITTEGFAEIEAVMRNSPSCVNGLVLWRWFQYQAGEITFGK